MTASPGNAAILFAPDAYVIDRKDLKGRHMAGAGFLAGVARHLQAPFIHGLCASGQAAPFVASLRAQGWNGDVRCSTPERLEAIAATGNFYCPDPILHEHAWRRRWLGARAYSLSGVIHSICSSSVISGLSALLVAPVQSWDAVICTSEAGRQVVAGVFEQWEHYLACRFAAPVRPVRPQLPVIPLGVEAARFQSADAGERRRRLRERLGIPEDELAVLFLGRLSFHGKAHPVPMLLALQRAAQQLGRRLSLLLAGRFYNDDIEASYREALTRYAPDLNAVVIDGTDDEAVGSAWFAADVFASLSDNIQETFGLTPIEAMAAGLPVVASDWDGYRDTVVDGETGFLIPTRIAPVGAGDLLARYYDLGALSYDRYIGYASLGTAIDIAACAEAFVRLAEDPGLRRRLGEAGRQRAVRHYDWSVVIAAYQQLWGELNARRAHEPESAPPPAGGPLQPLKRDPFAAFQGYATSVLEGSTRLALTTADPRDAIAGLMANSMNTYGLPTLFQPEDCQAVADHLLAQGPDTLAALAGPEPALWERRVRACAWLLKFGVLAVVPS